MEKLKPEEMKMELKEMEKSNLKAIAEPLKSKLSEQELLGLKNIQLQKRLNQVENERVMLEEKLWATGVSARLKLNIMNYSVDILTGECTRMGICGTGVEPPTKTESN